MHSGMFYLSVIDVMSLFARQNLTNVRSGIFIVLDPPNTDVNGKRTRSEGTCWGRGWRGGREIWSVNIGMAVHA